MTRQVIPTKCHAMEDYLTGAAAPALARGLGLSDTARHIVDGFAGVAGVQSMMTDYEGGLMRVLPMSAHLASDFVLGAGLITAAALMKRKSQADRWFLAGLGMVAVLSAIFSRTTPDDRRK